MRDAQVRRVPVVSDMGRLVGAISIDDLVLVAQNVRAGADARCVVARSGALRDEHEIRSLGEAGLRVSLPRVQPWGVHVGVLRRLHGV